MEEEVSDKELPGPKVEMLGGTEVMSDDKLPALEKGKHDDCNSKDLTDDSGEKRAQF